MTHLVAVEAPEASRYLDFIQNRGWRSVDFTRFSSLGNPAASAHDLSLDAILKG